MERNSRQDLLHKRKKHGITFACNATHTSTATKTSPAHTKLLPPPPKVQHEEPDNIRGSRELETSTGEGSAKGFKIINAMLKNVLDEAS